MKGIPQGRYTKEFREEAVKLVMEEKLNTARLKLENLLSDRKVELADIETVKSYVEDLRNLLEDSSLAERKSFIKSFVREVRVVGNEVVLKYNIPPSVGTPRQENLVVPPIVHYGGPSCTIGKTPTVSVEGSSGGQV